MHRLDDRLKKWICDFKAFEANFKPNPTEYESTAFKILFEAAAELYLSILIPSTTRSIKAILTRSLIECYADVYIVFKNDNPAKQAKKYVKYAEKMDRLFTKQARIYITERNQGKVTTRAFELARKYQACWNGMDVTSRVKNIDDGRHVIGYYEFFSLFAHVNPSRQLYLKHLDNSRIAHYHSYIMLVTLQLLVTRDFVPEKYFPELLAILTDYSEHYSKSDISPAYPEK